MPVATFDPNDVEEVPLTTLEDGKVTLRRMPYDAVLHRQDIMMRFQVESAEAREKGRPGQTMTMNMGSRETALFEFKQCIVDHNLTNAEGQKLDFTKAYTLKILDPRVGEEITKKIQDMNRFLSDDHLGNSGEGSDPISS